MADTKTQLALRLPQDLLAQADARAEALGISRNEWFTHMVRWVLKNTYVIEARGGEV